MGMSSGLPAMQKIGVFDSGLGGLTVLRQLLSVHPRCSYVYFGDTAHVPYGDRQAEEVIALVVEISRHLVAQGCQGLIVACNTSSALALSALRAAVEVPVLGVIDAGASEAVQRSRSGRIAILATPLTARSGVYAERLREAAQRRAMGSEPQVFEIGCPELVPIVESGELQSASSLKVLQTYAETLHQLRVDTVVLGCTHYPLLLPVLQPLLGDDIAVVDPASVMPLAMGEWPLSPSALGTGAVRYEVSGEPGLFESRATQFLGFPVTASRVALRATRRSLGEPLGA